MNDLQLDWATDLAILELSGSTVERLDDHLLVRTPQNPHYHWGNCLLVTDATAIDDAERWLARFAAAFPQADWVAIGLPSMPQDAHAWLSRGIELEQLDVLAARERPRSAPLSDGYTVREVAGDDWEQLTQHRLAENRASGEHTPDGYERFMRETIAARQSLCDAGDAVWFGAFAGDELVADLGIVRCGTIARYQDVATVEAHRRRGLASHLLGVAAEWSASRGCDTWVIVTESTNDAGRVYRRAGFALDAASVNAHRQSPGAP